MLDYRKAALFLFLQAQKESDCRISSEPYESDKADPSVSHLKHDSVWIVNRGICPEVSFRSEMAARIFGAGYSLDLAETIDGLPEEVQMKITDSIPNIKWTALGLSWIKKTQPAESRPAISGKFK